MAIAEKCSDFCRQGGGETALEIVDAYTHCGLSKYEPIKTVRDVMAASGVSRAVLVQHLGEFDNSYPVVGGKEDYLRDLRLLLDGRLPVPEEAVPAIAGGNAEALWFTGRNRGVS